MRTGPQEAGFVRGRKELVVSGEAEVGFLPFSFLLFPSFLTFFFPAFKMRDLSKFIS